MKFSPLEDDREPRPLMEFPYSETIASPVQLEKYQRMS